MGGTALVVGAGIGGLSAAIALRQIGWDVRVFERTSSARELGFGLLVAPNAMRALGELGVADVVLARGWAPAGFEARRPDGRLIRRLTYPPPDAMGGPTVVALRQALHGALLDAVRVDAITLDAEAVGFADAGDRVTLRLADGSTAEGDLLIGADGVHSALRRALHPGEPPPRSSRLVAVRGGVHGAISHLDGLSGIYYLGPGIEAFMVRASDTGIYWALSVAEELAPASREPRVVLEALTPRFDAAYRAVTGATTDMRCDELVDRDPLPWWGRGRVTLLGDAAHPVLPHTGQGAAQAITDAVALGRHLHDVADVPMALRAYEAERRPPTAALLGQGRRTAALMRSRSRVVDELRAAAIRVAPIAPFVRLYARLNRRAGTAARRASR